MKQNVSSDDQEIPDLWWNLEVNYYIHKNPTLVPVLSQMKPIRILVSYFFKICIAFDVLTAVKISMEILALVTSCRLGEYQRFGGAYCVHRQGCMFLRKVDTHL